jgi:hypothetical protein
MKMADLLKALSFPLHAWRTQNGWRLFSTIVGTNAKPFSLGRPRLKKAGKAWCSPAHPFP